MRPIAIGTDDFKEIIESNSLFIDKTLFIKDIIDDTGKVLLFPRPRRFGKSLNMSMINYYFNNSYDSKYLFDGLNISKCEDKYLMEMNKYPVISLSLKDCKKGTYLEFISSFKIIISDLYNNYKYLLESSLIDEVEKDYFRRCLKREEDIQLSLSLSRLMYMLKKHYNMEVIVLLDEYDAPIMEGYLKGYYGEIINFMRNLFSSTFKGNLDLKKGIITGILRVSKEGMFSGANNINVYNITDSLYSNYFGFLESEVEDVLKEYGLSDKFSLVKTWYDGYLFGKSTIYNPWSILCYLKDIDHKFGVYWANTGGVDLLKDLIYTTKGNTTLLECFHSLLEKGYIEHINLDMYMDLTNLNHDINTVFTLFMLSGYLTPSYTFDSYENVSLKIPNLEIRKNLENICINWFRENVSYADDLIRSLLSNDLYNFKNILLDIVKSSFSYYDLPASNLGESFYHAFVMGLLYINVLEFKITSNRESGYGRYDLLLEPKDGSCKYAYLIEFKALSNGDFSKTIEDAFKQIEEKEYANSFKDYDFTKIVIVFKGKEIMIETRK